MAVWYLDTSAAFKLLLRERESADLIAAISADRPTLVSSYLLETELRRAANRVGTLSQRQVTNLLDRVGLYELTPAMHTQAGLLPGVTSGASALGVGGRRGAGAPGGGMCLTLSVRRAG